MGYGLWAGVPWNDATYLQRLCPAQRSEVERVASFLRFFVSSPTVLPYAASDAVLFSFVFHLRRNVAYVKTCESPLPLPLPLRPCGSALVVFYLEHDRSDFHFPSVYRRSSLVNYEDENTVFR